MTQDPEVLDGPERPTSRRRRRVQVVIAASVVAVVALIAIPRLLDESSKDEPAAQTETTRKQLLVALGHENAARTDTRRASSAPYFAFEETHEYPADLAAFERARKKYRVTLAEGNSVPWYFVQGEEFIFCVEHQTDGKADAYALYASTPGNVVDTGHGRGCVRPADYADAAASVADLVSAPGSPSAP